MSKVKTIELTKDDGGKAFINTAAVTAITCDYTPEEMELHKERGWKILSDVHSIGGGHIKAEGTPEQLRDLIFTHNIKID